MLHSQIQIHPIFKYLCSNNLVLHLLRKLTRYFQMLLLPLFFVVANSWPCLWAHNSLNYPEVQRLKLMDLFLSKQLQNVPYEENFQRQELPDVYYIINHIRVQYPDLFQGFSSNKISWWNTITKKPIDQNIYIYLDDDQKTDANEDGKQDNAIKEQDRTNFSQNKNCDENKHLKPVSGGSNNADEVLPIDPRKDEAKFAKPH